MPEDRSLDDFAGANDGGGETGADDGAVDSADGDKGDDGDKGADTGTESDAAGVDPADAEVEPAVETSTWHADGAECDRCGERVERRWRDEDALVCADCASW